MNDIYVFGLFTTWALSGVVWIYVLGTVLWFHAKAYIHDEKVSRKGPSKFVPYSSYYDGGDGAFAIIIGFLIGMFGGLAWPLFWPVVICIGLLNGARKFIRFQKTYQAHKHDKETGLIA